MSKLVIIIILTLSLTLHFYHIAKLTRGLAPIEVAHALLAHELRSLSFGNRQFSSSFDTPSFAYSAFASIMFSVFDYGIWQLRATSALAGTASAISLYFLAYKLLQLGSHRFSNNTPLHINSFLATIIFIFSPWSIHFSRFASAHNLGLAIYLLGTWLFSLLLSSKSGNPTRYRYLIIFAFSLSLFLAYSCVPYFAAASLLGCALILICFVYRKIIPYLVAIYLVAIFYLILSGKLAIYFSYYSLINLFFGLDIASVYRVSEVGLLLAPFLPFLLLGIYHIATLPTLRAYFFTSILVHPLLLLLFSPQHPNYANGLVLLPYLSLGIALGLTRFTKLLRSYRFAFRFSNFLPFMSGSLIFVFAGYAFMSFWHIYHQHYPLDAWPQWSTHWTKGALYIAQSYPQATQVVMEESPEVISYVQFFDLVFHNQVSRTLIGLESATALHASLPDGAVVGISGWRATPPNFQNTHHISLPDQQGTVIYKIGLWRQI